MIIQKDERNIKEGNANYIVYDYKLGSIDTNINLYEIKGRMPENNYMISRKADRCFYVASGEGSSYVDGVARPIGAGDVVFVNAGARYYFEGVLTLVGMRK